MTLAPCRTPQDKAFKSKQREFGWAVHTKVERIEAMRRTKVSCDKWILLIISLAYVVTTGSTMKVEENDQPGKDILL